MLLMIDNFDSFTHNIVRYLGELGAEIEIVRNDEKSLEELSAMQPEKLVISPGPGTPAGAGISMAAIEHFAGRVPILGICLGHQSIGQVFGAKVVRAEQVMHGKNSLIYHENTGVFQGLNNPLSVTRYHSLLVDPDSLPDCLEAIAWAERADGGREIMGLRHKEMPIEGVQFHPEAIMTEQGYELLENFVHPKR